MNFFTDTTSASAIMLATITTVLTVAFTSLRRKRNREHLTSIDIHSSESKRAKLDEAASSSNLFESSPFSRASLLTSPFSYQFQQWYMFRDNCYWCSYCICYPTGISLAPLESCSICHTIPRNSASCWSFWPFTSWARPPAHFYLRPRHLFITTCWWINK